MLRKKPPRLYFGLHQRLYLSFHLVKQWSFLDQFHSSHRLHIVLQEAGDLNFSSTDSSDSPWPRFSKSVLLSFRHMKNLHTFYADFRTPLLYDNLNKQINMKSIFKSWFLGIFQLFLDSNGFLLKFDFRSNLRLQSSN